MAAPTVIKSTDSGVPVLSGVAGSFINLLDYVLVTRLGWTKEFSGTNKAIYKPAASLGNRMLYKFDHSNANYYMAWMAESASDVDNLAAASTTYYGQVSCTANTTARAWEIVGDAYGFHMFICNGFNSWGVSEHHYFGECIPIFSTDVWFSIITGKNSYTSSYLTHDDVYSNSLCYGSEGYNYEKARAARHFSGATGNSVITIRGGGTLFTNGNGVGSPYNTKYPYPTDGKLIYTRPLLCDPDDSSNVRTMRGYYPGVYDPITLSGLVDRSEISADGKLFRVYRYLAQDEYYGRSLAAANILLDISENYR